MVCTTILGVVNHAKPRTFFHRIAYMPPEWRPRLDAIYPRLKSSCLTVVNETIEK